MLDCRSFYINGQWVSAASTCTVIDVENPATLTTVGKIAAANHEDVDMAVAAARRAFDTYSQTSLKERLALLKRVCEAYDRRREELAEIVTAEMGATKVLSRAAQTPSGLGHLQAARDALETYSFKSTLSDTDVCHREPIGVCAFITPWNWPLNQVAAKVAPALATGCTCVLKPSEIAPLSAHLFAEILHEAGVPAGVFNLVDGNGPDVGAYMAEHPDVDMISFTGSTRAGIDVSRRAAQTVKRVTLELGGKSPNVILDDADLATAVRVGTLNCMSNVGQTCDAPTRMLVPQSMMSDAIALAAETASSLVTGDPTADGVDNGPIAFERQYTKVVSLIQKGIDEGAQLACGGVEKPERCGVGYYVRPTVFGRVTHEMTIAREEIFGPVLSIIGYADEEEAIRLANDSPYGLAAYVSSGDLDRARRVATRLRAGQVHINDAEASYDTPFGGYKQSGNGREGGRYGFEDFVEHKAILGFDLPLRGRPAE